MPSLMSAQQQKRFKLLQIGESGHGKTFRSLSATKFGKVYVFDLDEKLRATAENLSDERKSLVDYDNYTNTTVLNKFTNKEEVTKHGYDKVITKINELKKENPYNTIVLDTWSRVYDLMTDKIFGNKIKLEFDDWNLIKVTQKEFLMSLLSLDANIIINTHIGRKENAQGQQVMTVGTSGTFGMTLPQYFNETHYLYYDTLSKKYRARGKMSSDIVANTAIAADKFDDRGNFLIDDLSIFESIAKKVENV